MASSADEKFGIRRISVTGAMISKYQGKDVRLIGQVIKSGPVDTLEVNTGDGTIVNVKLQEPLDEPVEGLVEVQGRVSGRTSVNGSYLLLTSDPPFDLQTYSDVLTTTASFVNPWTLD